MNFISGFVLELSGLKEFETFDFLVQFLKSPSRLFVGLFEAGFPMLGFLVFQFNKLLEETDKRRHKQVVSCGLPLEMWLVKWLLTLFTGYFTKPFLLRIWDVLMVEDYMAPVYVGLVIVMITKRVLFTDFESTIGIIQNGDKLCEAMDLRKFVKKLQRMKVSTKRQKELLNEYYLGLKKDKKDQFKDFYKRLLVHLHQKERRKRKCRL